MSLLHRVHERGEDPGPCKCHVCVAARQRPTDGTTLAERIATPPRWRANLRARDETGRAAA